MHRRHHPTLGILILAALLASGEGRLHAREPSKKLNNAAYVEVDVDAEGELENARRLVLEGRLADAVTQYSQVRYRHPAKLHLLVESPGRFQLYVPIRVFVDETLRNMPPQGREFFLQMVDPEAESTYHQARRNGKPSDLRAFVDAYGSSSWGSRGRTLLGDLMAERGRLQEALYAWEPLLAGGATPSGIVGRLGFAYARLGRIVEMRRLIATGAPGTKALKRLKFEVRGKTARGERSTPDPGEVISRLKWIYHVEAMEASLRFGPGGFSGVQPVDPAGRNFPSLFPTVNRGMLFLNMGREQEPPPEDEKEEEGEGGEADPASTYPLVAVHLRTGSTVSGATSMTPPIPYHLPRSVTDSIPVAEPRLDTTIAGGKLFVNRWVPGRLNRSQARWGVAALDLSATADLTEAPPVLWEWTPGGVDDIVGPAPAAAGTRVFVPFCTVRKRDVFHYVAALDAATGREFFRTFISAHPHGGSTEGSVTSKHIPQPSPLLVRHGRVFVATNQGTVAALDASTGQLLWVLKYAIPEKGTVWFSNPLSYSEGILVVAPKEFPFLLSIDPPTGRPLWSYWHLVHGDWGQFKHFLNSRLEEEGGGPQVYDTAYRHLLGVRRGRAVFTSRSQVAACHVTDGRLAWICSLAGEQVTGRGMITDHRVYVPTRAGVVVLDLETGRRPRGTNGTFDYLIRWADFCDGDGPLRLPEEFEGGNLLFHRAPRRWCFTSPKEEGKTCRGVLLEEPDGGLKCSLCGRRHDSSPHFFLVAVDKGTAACFALDGADDPKGGGEGEGK
ncbi:MAG: outer membrane protein assembly factor BamB family protein [Planctomycetota bacterium]|jgi:outer membrane protein assembly factor BamB